MRGYLLRKCDHLSRREIIIRHVVDTSRPGADDREPARASAEMAARLVEQLGEREIARKVG